MFSKEHCIEANDKFRVNRQHKQHKNIYNKSCAKSLQERHERRRFLISDISSSEESTSSSNAGTPLGAP
eukprot:5797729-Pleurochrysis_carterae.AAC.1